MTLEMRVNGNSSGRDVIYASVAGRRFPAPVSLRNDSDEPIEAELRVRPGSGAKVTVSEARLTVPPGGVAQTTLLAETPSLQLEDTVLEVLVNGTVQAEFRLTVVSLLRESVFHNLAPKPSSRS
ncbi:MAG: hypothetical protein HY236_08185 [Acidobacteria bacterium]|nr:hypothetical protein [Acidobacteriota bacterium]